MIAQGSINPQKIWIRYIDENNNTIIRLTRNVIEKNINNGIGETIHIFEYEEIEINIQNRDNLEQYIETNFDLLFEKGLSDYEFKKQLNEKEKQINDLISNYKLLEVNKNTQDSINNQSELVNSLIEMVITTTLPTT